MTVTRDLIRIRHLAKTGVARTIRETAGLSLSEMASAAQVDKSTVWRWEHGQRRPKGDAAQRYLAVLDDLVSR
jgi:DNA-binding transcriptional regulator YiaG